MAEWRSHLKTQTGNSSDFVCIQVFKSGIQIPTEFVDFHNKNTCPSINYIYFSFCHYFIVGSLNPGIDSKNVYDKKMVFVFSRKGSSTNSGSM